VLEEFLGAGKHILNNENLLIGSKFCPSFEAEVFAENATMHLKKMIREKQGAKEIVVKAAVWEVKRILEGSG
jgi:hypothetical protein